MNLKRNYKGNRKLLIRLFKRHEGVCCYCGCNTILPISGYAGVQPNNMATIEHIYGNFSIIRMLLKNIRQTKLSCYNCNQIKGREENKKQREGYNYSERHDGLLLNLLKKKKD